MNAKIIEMCQKNQTGPIWTGVPDQMQAVWDALEIPEQYRCLPPYFNLIIWDLSKNPLTIHLENKESKEQKTIIPVYDDSEVFEGTLFKYSN